MCHIETAFLPRNQEPVSDDAIEGLSTNMELDRPFIRETLANKLGGEPVDYDAEVYLNNRSTFQKIARMVVSSRPSEPDIEGSTEATIEGEDPTLRRQLSYDAVWNEEPSSPGMIDVIAPWKDTEASATVTRYLIQLEYKLDGEWRSVVEYEHNPAERPRLDATDGVVLCVYRDGERQTTEVVSPKLPASIALDFAQSYLNEHLLEFVRRFECWYGVE